MDGPRTSTPLPTNDMVCRHCNLTLAEANHGDGYENDHSFYRWEQELVAQRITMENYNQNENDHSFYRWQQELLAQRITIENYNHYQALYNYHQALYNPPAQQQYGFAIPVQAHRTYEDWETVHLVYNDPAILAIIRSPPMPLSQPTTNEMLTMVIDEFGCIALPSR